jgi:flagellar biosynthesis protein FlhG
MLDQASRLREMAAAYRAQAASARPLRRTRVLAVTSGKGGVGKTNISVNLAHSLIGAGKEVLLLDADLGLANADILLGTVPPYHLGHLLRGERSIRELIHRTPSGLKLIAGGSGVEELAQLPAHRLRLFVEALQALDGEADYLILDTGAGLSQTVLAFVLACDQVLVVTTPEPTSIADGYATIKALSYRRPGIDVKLVVNQAERLEEAEAAAERIASTARNFLGMSVDHLGTVPRDPYVWQAVRQQQPFFLAFPGAPASRAIDAMGRKLISGGGPQFTPTKAPGFFERLAGMFGKQAI